MPDLLDLSAILRRVLDRRPVTIGSTMAPPAVLVGGMARLDLDARGSEQPDDLTILDESAHDHRDGRGRGPTAQDWSSIRPEESVLPIEAVPGMPALEAWRATPQIEQAGGFSEPGDGSTDPIGTGGPVSDPNGRNPPPAGSEVPPRIHSLARYGEPGSPSCPDSEGVEAILRPDDSEWFHSTIVGRMPPLIVGESAFLPSSRRIPRYLEIEPEETPGHPVGHRRRSRDSDEDRGEVREDAVPGPDLSRTNELLQQLVDAAALARQVSLPAPFGRGRLSRS